MKSPSKYAPVTAGKRYTSLANSWATGGRRSYITEGPGRSVIRASSDESQPVYKCAVYHPVLPFNAEPYLQKVTLGKSDLPKPIFTKDVYKTFEEQFDFFFGNPERFEKHDIPHKRSVLLIGPPGNGKTFLIQSMLREICKNKFNTYGFEITRENFSILHSMGLNSWLKKYTYKDSKWFFFLEDFQELLDAHGKMDLLQAMQGIKGIENQFIIATTNYPEVIPKEFLRPGRFDRIVLINRPTWPVRKAILTYHFTKSNYQPDIPENQWNTVKDLTEGMSGVYLSEIFKIAVCNELDIAEACQAVREYFDSIPGLINYEQDSDRRLL